MLSIGIDLGGTNIVAAVVNEEYKMLATAKDPDKYPQKCRRDF